MNTIAINYKNESTRDVEICNLQNVEDLILIEEAKREFQI